MKTLIFCLALFCSLNTFAVPQTDCFDNATNHRNMSPDTAIALCAGATSNATLKCFDYSEKRNLSLRDRIFLCRGATDTTLNCFDHSETRNLTIDQRIDLCGTSSLIR